MTRQVLYIFVFVHLLKYTRVVEKFALLIALHYFDPALIVSVYFARQFARDGSRSRKERPEPQPTCRDVSLLRLSGIFEAGSKT